MILAGFVDFGRSCSAWACQADREAFAMLESMPIERASLKTEAYMAYYITWRTNRALCLIAEDRGRCLQRLLQRDDE